MSNPELISYLGACFKNGRLIRWPDNTMPLTVYVAPFRWYREKGQEHEYYGMIVDAFKIWETASHGRLKFEFVSNLYNSQINIEWKRVERKSLGHCKFNFDGLARLYSAEVSIGLSDGLIHQKYMDRNEVFHTIIHEIGHSLGLNHSPFPEDIMYVPHQYGVTSVSARDLITLKWLYTFPYGISEQEILNHYKIPGSYGVDRLIYKLEIGETAQKKPAQQEELLHDEQKTLSELGKFNVSIQDVNISPDKHEYFKKLRIKRDFK